MSAFDNCLFYRTTATKTTYIIVYVDDTSFIFSNFAKNIGKVIASVGKHYEVTLDREATSFLGLYLTHNSDGTVTITQPKQLQKIFALYPPRKDSMHKPTILIPRYQKTLTHPRSPQTPSQTCASSVSSFT